MITVLVLGLAACVGTRVDAAPAAVALPDQPMADVQRLIGQATCTRDADCRSAAVGERACGGPERYLAWSARVTDEAALGAALARESARQAAQAAKQGRASTCVFVPDPGARCMATAPAATGTAAAQRCMLGNASGAEAAR